MKFTHNSIADVQTTVGGIPCIAAVLDYDMSDDDEGTLCGRMNWVICDRKGYKANWLEKKMTVKEESRINDEVIDYMERKNESF
jgi:hypothetical protein